MKLTCNLVRQRMSAIKANLKSQEESIISLEQQIGKLQRTMLDEKMELELLETELEKVTKLANRK